MDDWYERMRINTEAKYLATVEALRQSGFSGSEERWETLRRPVADCVDRSGSFLDVGCANGYLLECVARWVGARGIELGLYGLDISAELVERARRRLPHMADRLWVKNAFSFTPPRRFDFVRTELLYVPAERERDYLRHLLDAYLAPGGSLLVANYLEGADPADAASRVDPGASVTTDIVARLAELGYAPARVRDGFDPVKGRRMRVAVVSAVGVT